VAVGRTGDCAVGGCGCPVGRPPQRGLHRRGAPPAGGPRL